MALYFRVAKPSEYLMVTGFGVNDIKITKRAWILPGQRCTTLDLSPVNYQFDVQAMSSEKLPFTLPAVFTVGPKHDDKKALYQFAKLVPSDRRRLEDIVKGVIEGEARVLAASMSMEEIFQGSEEFKHHVFTRIQLELEAFGLHVYNANVKQLVDVEGHEYFSFLGKKTQKEAENQALVDVAEADYKGAIGTKASQALTVQNAAQVDANTEMYIVQKAAEARRVKADMDSKTGIWEDEKEAERAEAASVLAIKKAKFTQLATIAQIESAKNAEIHDKSMQQIVERKNAEAELERLRAENLTKAVIEFESKGYAAKTTLTIKQKEADAMLYRRQSEADANLWQKEREADAMRALASASSYQVRSMCFSVAEVCVVFIAIVWLCFYAFSFPSCLPPWR